MLHAFLTLLWATALNHPDAVVWLIGVIAAAVIAWLSHQRWWTARMTEIANQAVRYAEQQAKVGLAKNKPLSNEDMFAEAMAFAVAAGVKPSPLINMLIETAVWELNNWGKAIPLAPLVTSLETTGSSPGATQ